MARRLLGLLLVVLLAGTVEAGERPKVTVLTVGWAGAGKGTAGTILARQLRDAGVGASHFSGGDHLRAKAARMGGHPGAFGAALKSIKGKSQVELMKEGLGEDLPDVVVIDGPRSPADIAALRADVPSLIVVAVDAPAHMREVRLATRARDAHESAASVGRRDARDVKRGLPDVMNAADVTIHATRGLEVMAQDLRDVTARVQRELAASP